MTRLPFKVSGAKRHLDMPWVKHALKTSYWGQWMSDEAIQTAVNNSLTFGAYYKATGEQIGFCRVVTDRAVFSSITDMLVTPAWQRKGVGSVLLREALANPWVSPTICIIASRDARGFYARHGFIEVGGDCMKRDPV